MTTAAKFIWTYEKRCGIVVVAKNQKGCESMVFEAPKVAMYIRLSREDLRLGESLSVENQRILLTNYAEEQGWRNLTEYVDDGYSGVNFDRPSFKRMMSDVHDGKINLIICKDMSRFGRNYIQVGEFTDYILPSAGCGLIALNDGVDTRSNIENDMMPFRNLFNEFYCRDLSKKVKTGRNVRCQQGKYLGSYAPLGYILDPKDRYHYAIDPFGAELVKRIFGMRCEGMSILAIAKKMNDEGIITPRDYWYQLKEKENPRNVTHKWTDVTVSQILHNEAYIGNMVQNKQGCMSYKNKKFITKPPEEHIRVEGTHEPIIDMETWKTVRKMDAKKKFRSGKDKQPSMFSGLLKCADCGMSMKITKDMRPNADGSSRDLHSYVCRTYANGGKSACTSHRIREPILIEIVRQNLAQYIQKLKYSESELRKELMSRKDNNGIKSVKQQLTYSQKRIAELDKLIENLYVDKVSGTIPQSAFDRLIQKYETEHTELEERIKELKIRVEDSAKDKDDVDRWIEIMKGYMKSGEIDRPLLVSLIDTITVGEVREENGEKVRDIRIKYNFVGEI